MPATVHYAPTYPSLTKPVQADATIGSDGLITGSIVFVAPTTTQAYRINQPISPNLFDSLSGIAVQGLFVETRQMEKRNGLSMLRLAVVGAVNPPAFHVTKTLSQKSLSKTIEVVSGEGSSSASISFDYYAESYAMTTVATIGQAYPIEVPEPTGGEVWNLQFTPIPGLAGQASVAPFAFYGISPRVLTNETREQRGGVVRITKTADFVYE